eukprot:gnl/TRDRNA2_/TRDRNA2_123916_c1_seq1.p1 gnl/TRDRNA2_/TRDRNA2_123916_c1~~gnl/TRDRNA2_/TRDRNA2_123916_c1_seq1.p1  ORF type:complete len:297 (+),score=44.76 gnl/TRDRNA2_/TRDRNA2_123916_c1_seq1:101-892(+)
MAPRDVAGLAFAFTRAHVAFEPLLEGLLAHSCGLLTDSLSQCCYRGGKKSLFRKIYVGDKSAEQGKVDPFDMGTLADVIGACAEQPASLSNQVTLNFLTLACEYAIKGLSQRRGQYEDCFLSYPETAVKGLLAFVRLVRGEGSSHLARGGRALNLSALLAAATPHCLQHMSLLGARDVAGLLSAVAYLRPAGGQLQMDLRSRLRKLVAAGEVRDLSPADAADALWALGELSLDDAELQAHLLKHRRQATTMRQPSSRRCSSTS